MVKICFKICSTLCLAAILTVAIPKAVTFSLSKLGPTATLAISALVSVDLWLMLVIPYFLEPYLRRLKGRRDRVPVIPGDGAVAVAGA